MLKSLIQLDIVLSIYNQEKLIKRVLYGIFKNTTTPFNLILVFDGCTDKSELMALSYIKKSEPKLLKELIICYASNVYETRANNIGFRKAKTDYMLTLQDDMVVNEYGWERRLTYPLRKFDDIFAVSSRTAQDIGLMKDLQNQSYFINQVSRELHSLPRNIFAIRDSINRGPVAFNMKYLRSLDYLNENFAPSDLDDADLCLRAWKEKGLRCGAFSIDYISRREWGKARSKDSNMYADNHIPKNAELLKKNHGEYISSQIKHSEDILIPESEIDYISEPMTIRNIMNRIIKKI
jgi:glycosyltransferase involved in cell wall biosynthesis